MGVGLDGESALHEGETGHIDVFREMYKVGIEGSKDLGYYILLEIVEQHFVLHEAHAALDERYILDKNKEEVKSIFVSLLWHGKPLNYHLIVALHSEYLLQTLPKEEPDSIHTVTFKLFPVSPHEPAIFIEPAPERQVYFIQVERQVIDLAQVVC
jgi:hypothetical protein